MIAKKDVTLFQFWGDAIDHLHPARLEAEYAKYRIMILYSLLTVDCSKHGSVETYVYSYPVDTTL